MKIAISGCGITGASAGFMLAEQGHDVTIFEQANECRSVGAGILVSPVGQLMLERMGLLSTIENRSAVLEGIYAQTASGRTLVKMDYSWLSSHAKYGGVEFGRELYGLGVHRGLLFEELLSRCYATGVKIRNGFRVASHQVNPDGVSLQSDDGKRESGFDFLIVADGSRSPLRNQTGCRVITVDYDYAALLATAPCTFQPGRLFQVVRGTQFLLGLLPIGDGTSSFFWGLPAGGFQELKETGFEKWREQVIEIFPESESVFSTIRKFDDLTYAPYRHVSMSKWVFDRVIFLGDAAHPTSPHLGQGVNLALEDVCCFVSALKEKGSFEEACQEFAKQRKRKLRYYQLLTRLISPFFQSSGFVKGMGRNCFLPLMPYTPVVRREMLRTLCGFKGGWIA